jgi:hypothetical protein
MLKIISCVCFNDPFKNTENKFPLVFKTEEGNYIVVGQVKRFEDLTTVDISVNYESEIYSLFLFPVVFKQIIPEYSNPCL